MNFMRWLIPAPKVEETKSPLFDLRRRGFIFGAAATLIIPPPKSFYFLDGGHNFVFPELITIPKTKLFELPDREALQLWMKLLDEQYTMKDIPQWVVVDKQWYNDVVAAQARGAKWDERRQDHERRDRRAGD